MQEQASFGSIKDLKFIEFEILRKAEELQIPVKKDNLKITRSREAITVEAHYEITIDFFNGAYKYVWKFDPVVVRPTLRGVRDRAGRRMPPGSGDPVRSRPSRSGPGSPSRRCASTSGSSRACSTSARPPAATAATASPTWSGSSRSAGSRRPRGSASPRSAARSSPAGKTRRCAKQVERLVEAEAAAAGAMEALVRRIADLERRVGALEAGPPRKRRWLLREP